MTEDRLIDLEMRLTFQDDQIHVLNREVHRQHQLIEKLSSELQELRQRLSRLTPSPLQESAENEPPPPHY